jgi:chromosome segregation ATPase
MTMTIENLSSGAVALKEHLELRCDSIEKQGAAAVRYLDDKLVASRASIEARFEWLERTTKDVREAMEERLKTLNELRQVVDRGTAVYASIDRVEGIEKGIRAELRPLQENMAQTKGMATQHSVTRATVLAVIAAIAGLCSMVFSVMRVVKP